MATQEEDEPAPFFVEALFPFTGTDASSLSFVRGDVIQVLSRLPSGWWDGVLDEERGWFPSNYVRPITEAEAEEAFARREMERQHEEDRILAHAHANALVDLSHHGQQQQQQQQLAHSGHGGHAHGHVQQQQQQQAHRVDQYAHQQHGAYWDDRATPAQDFWIPEVSENGQIYYVNSLTGQQSLDLPTDDTDHPPSQAAHHAHAHAHQQGHLMSTVPHINTNVPHSHSHSHGHPAGSNGTPGGGGYIIPGQGRQRSGTTNSAASSSRVDPISATTSHRSGADMIGSYSSATSAAPGGFGLLHRSETPEPWEKRITDDGQTYYYVNTITEEARWTRPEPLEYSSSSNANLPKSHQGQHSGRGVQQSGQYNYNPYSNQPHSHFPSRSGGGGVPHTRNRTDSEASFSGRERDNRRASVYSDDSEVSPMGKELRGALAMDSNNLSAAAGAANGAGGVRPWPTPGAQGGELAGVQGDAPNPLQIALSIQDKVSPGPLPPLTVYSDRACEAIGAVVEAYIDTAAATATSASGTAASGSGTSNGDDGTNSSTTSLQGQPQANGDGERERTSIDAARIQTMADRVALVVVAVRNLLYVSGTLTGTLPPVGNSANGGLNGNLSNAGLNGVGAGLTEDVDWVRQEIKPFQRKVTATLSKLVLSARAVNANPDWPTSNAAGGGGGGMGKNARVESDAAELERAVTTFVYQIQRTAASSRAKRLHGVMLPGEGPSGIGFGLIGAGVGGGWKGAGFVTVGNGDGMGTVGPERRLGREVVSELAGLRVAADEKMGALRGAVEAYKSALAAMSQAKSSTSNGVYDSRAADLVILNGRLVVAHITDFLLHAEDVHIAVGVDVMGSTDDDEAYLAGVKRARELIRTFETAKQALYDDGSVLLMASQAIHVSSLGTSTSASASISNGPADVLLLTAMPALQSNLGTVMETLELLLDIAHEQDEVQSAREPPIGQMEYPHHPDHYREKLLLQQVQSQQYPSDAEMVLGKLGMASREIGSAVGLGYDDLGANGEVDLGMAFGHGGGGGRSQGGSYVFGERRSVDGGVAPSDITQSTATASTVIAGSSGPGTSIAASSTAGPSDASTAGAARDGEESDDPDFPASRKPATPGPSKIEKIFGTDAPAPWAEMQKQNAMPQYLRLDHTSAADIVLNPDGAVRAGTLPALIERLTMHSGNNARFNDTFMMTFKSFSTIDQFFDMLVERYNIQPPEGLTTEQFDEWTLKKKTPIRLRSINTMRKLIDVLEKEDLHILDRVKTFANQVIQNDPDRAGVARTLLHIVQRVEKNGIESKRTMHTTTSDFPPPSILPRKAGKIKLLDIDPLELARQLTIMESELFFKIKQSECIARSKESAPSGPDNIKSVITVTNKMADWVADAVLSKEDPRRRAAVIKHFINVAERCRHLANYSSMAALIAGLNCPPIRRLKRTWEQVNMRVGAVLDDLEKTLDTAHNFQGYKSLISSLAPPCVPFLGVYLTVLTFIQDGAKDTLKEGGLINFQKRQKTADVIQEITKFQMQPYNLTKLPTIRAFIEDSLTSLDNVPDFWQLSLEREPREREDEKMARLLQESGFL